MKRSLLLAFALFCFWYSALPQDYSYTHYDISDGLAGSTVYCITQDKDGFIWTGTETGVSRFDGTHFRNFTTKDGLPDVEILEMFGDSRGRVWMAPFRKSICYYYKGKIYNQDNDSLLRSMHFRGNIQHFAEDASGAILIQESSALHLLHADGQMTVIDSIHGKPIVHCHAISSSLDGHFLVQHIDSLYQFDGSRFTTLFRISFMDPIRIPGYICISPGTVVWRKTNDSACIRSLTTGRMQKIPFAYLNYRHVGYSIVSDSLIYTNESAGSTEFNFHSGQTKNFLPGVEVSRTFRDDEGNTWFTTIGQGLFRLNSAFIRNIHLRQPFYSTCSVHAIKELNNELLVGSNRNSIFRFRLPGLESLGLQRLDAQEKKRVVFIDTLDKGRMIYGTDYNLEVRANRKDTLNAVGVSIKSAYLKNKHQLLVAGSGGAIVVTVNPFGRNDTLWSERATTLYYRNDTTYVGTLNGLYRITESPKRHTEFLGRDIPFLRKRIAAIVESSSGILWIAPYDDAGIIGLQNDRIVRQLGRQQGLTSDICKTMALEKDYLWVGTDKGLNKIDLRYPDAPIMQFTANDGLGSNVINTIFVDSPMVYVGTPAGLSVFDETKATSSERCRLSLLDITSSGKTILGDSSHLHLSYQQNNIHFEFVGISYKSAGNILYKYRLIGLDTAWKTTKETFLDYPTLPSGNYALQIFAINKFGTISSQLSQHFTIATPFWRTTWFAIVVLAAFLSFVWFIVSLRIRQIRRRQQEEKQLHRRMTEMEHMALLAQMNPHFIFNCLNSIQQYIFNQDIFAANKYITGFSKLIRETLQNSTRSFITIGDEVSFLSAYLSLEKLRFKDKMDFSITVAPDIDQHTVIIPPMLIQPYAENSMRHGLRHKTTGKGFIRIAIERSARSLTITVEDNGIGRETAARYKTAEHIEYQSRGMTLTAERISMMNTIHDEGIGVNVIDLSDDQGRPAGTRVIVRFPLFDSNIKSDIHDKNHIG